MVAQPTLRQVLQIACVQCGRGMGLRYSAVPDDPGTWRIVVDKASVANAVAHVKLHRHPAIKPNRRRVHRRRP